MNLMAAAQVDRSSALGGTLPGVLYLASAASNAGSIASAAWRTNGRKAPGEGPLPRGFRRVSQAFINFCQCLMSFRSKRGNLDGMFEVASRPGQVAQVLSALSQQQPVFGMATQTDEFLERLDGRLELACAQLGVARDEKSIDA
jgi:hypothetical protein